MEARKILGWLTPEEVSDILGYTVDTLRTMRSRKEGPVHYKAGRVRYQASDVDAYLRSRKVNK